MSVSQITPTLFLSGSDGPLNAALVSQKGITLIVNATLSHACPAYPGVECVRVPVADLPSARLGDHFDRVAERIHANRAGGTLVHCAAGMSRSPALVMAYLMRYRAVTLHQAHRWVKESRPYVRLNAGFWDQLLQYERRLYGKNTVRVAAPEETPPPLPPPRTSRLLRSVPPQQQMNWLTTAPRTPLMTSSPLMTRSQRMTSSPLMTSLPLMTRSPLMTSSPLMTRSPLMTSSPLMTRSKQMTSANKSRRGTKSSSFNV